MLTSKIDLIQLDSNEYIELLSKEHSSGFWLATFEVIREYNSPICHGGILRFQQQIINNKTFSIPSPFSGEQIKATESVLLQGHFIGYRFEDKEPFWLFTTWIADSRQIGSIYLERQDVQLLFSKKEIPEHLIYAAISLDFTYNIDQVPEVRCCLGHQNFAHHTWNELSPLMESLQFINMPSTVFVSCMPLLDIRSIFPIIAEIIYIERKDVIHERGVLWVSPAGRLITKKSRERLVQLLKDTLTYDEQQLLESLQPSNNYYWISVRSHNKSLDNQVEFLVRVINKILQHDSNAIIYLDGFSLPVDINSSNYYQNDYFKGVAIKTSCEAQHIIDLCNNSVRIINGTSLSFPLSIVFAGKCSFYICHHGTQQHKIGWFYNVPGIVHTNHTIIESCPAKFVVSQSEGTIEPTYVKSTIVQPSKNESKLAPIFSNYNINPEFFLNELESALDDIPLNR